MEIYRGNVLALTVRSIGEAAQLRVVDGRFQPVSQPVSAPLVSPLSQDAPSLPLTPSHAPTATIGSSLAA